MKKTNLLIFSFLISLNVFADPIQDLYVDLMPEKFRTERPNESYKSFRVHLKDSDQRFPLFAEIKDSNINPINDIKLFSGFMLYVEVFPKAYSYSVLYQNQKYIFHIKINLKNPTPEDVISFTTKIKQAEKEWNDFKVPMDFNYEFKFDIESDPSNAHYSVGLLDKTRGPYDTNWSRDWDSQSIAHEIGHMMGLGDEYQTLSSVTDCLPESKMCHSQGKIMKHHYYFILRRLLK